MTKPQPDKGLPAPPGPVLSPVREDRVSQDLREKLKAARRQKVAAGVARRW
jgi:hypothetical protein